MAATSPSSPLKQICVIGAGLAGLSAAYDLGRAGHRVTVLEASHEIGGLASSLRIGDQPVEHFYHFICQGDDDLLELVEELGIQDRLHWQQTRTSFFYNGRLYRFGSPFDLLRFTPVPVVQRIRFGLNVIVSRYAKEWRKLDGVPAKAWLIRQVGEQAYTVIWDPLLRVKFGEHHDQVSAAWIWHRIHRVANSRRRLWEHEQFGYLELGSETVIDALAQRLRRMPNVDLRTRVRVEHAQTENGQVTGLRLADGAVIACDSVISTVALPVLLKIAPDLPDDYRRRLGEIDYLGVVCGLLRLRRPITDSFWVNVNDPHIPFNGFIEYSNLNRHLHLGSSAITYVPYYLRTSAPRYSFSDEQLLDEFVDGLRRVNPAFERSWVEECHISRATYAQAICTVGFADRVPGHRTPLAGLYITDSAQFYPADRTISSAIQMGRRVARMINSNEPARTEAELRASGELFIV
jgi:protoporphyrinogen oxidase